MSEEKFGGWPLPKSWAWARFEDVANIAQNLVAPSKVPDLPHIAPNYIGSGNRQLLPYSTVRADGVISPKQRFYPGQILFTKIRPYLLKSVLVDFEGVCSADMYPLWTKETAEPKYLLYWLTSQEFRDEIALEQGRTVLPKINQPALNRSMVALPPLPEQRRIMSKIDSLSASSKRAREQLDHVPRLVEKYKQAILTAAFRGDLTQSWRKTTAPGAAPNLAPLSEMCASITDGDHQAPPRAETGIPFITISAMNNGKIDLRKATRFVPRSYFDNLKPARRPSDGDVLYSVTGSFGIPALVDVEQPFVFQRHIAILKPDRRKVAVAFLFRMLAAPQILEQARSVATGTAQLTVPLTALREFLLPFPTLDEQREVVRIIENAFAWIDRLASETASARKLVDHLDQAILAKAFRGELVPQDPNDEPASVLLERIKAGRLSNARASKERKKTAPARLKPRSSRKSKSTASSKRSLAKRITRTR